MLSAMPRATGARWLLVVTITLAACGPDEPWVSGTVKLADGVDPSMYERLELRVFPRDVQHEPPDATEPEAEPVMTQTIELEGFAFPHGFDLRGEELYDASRGHVTAWMTVRRGSTWWEEGEPFGATLYEMCECATHTPAYANDVVVTLELEP